MICLIFFLSWQAHYQDFLFCFGVVVGVGVFIPATISFQKEISFFFSLFVEVRTKTFALFLPHNINHRLWGRVGGGRAKRYRVPVDAKLHIGTPFFYEKLSDSGDCTTVATQPRQLHYSNNLSKKRSFFYCLIFSFFSGFTLNCL